MTSIFDQYEQDSQQTLGTSSSAPQNVIPQEEHPIFQRQKVNFSPITRITHLVISSNYLVLAMANNVLLRFDLQNSKSPQEIDLSRIVNSGRLTGLFLDPTSDHLLITFTADLLYQHKKFPKPKPTSKFRGHEITAVAWNTTAGSPGDSTTKPLLLGTSRGIIFETEISSDESLFSSTREIYCKQVFDIGKGKPISITGLQYHRCSLTNNMYFVIATTVDRLYQFVGSSSGPDERPLLQHLFNNYLTKPEGFQELPSSLKYSCLQLHQPGPRMTPTTIGWLTSTGIFYGQIDASNKDNILTKTRMLSFPNMNDPPVSFLLTEFHILLLYHDHITAISILNEKLVFHDYYNEAYGKVLNIIKDPIKGTIWVYTECGIFRYKVTEEDRNVWQIFLERGEYEMAEKYCKSNPAKLDKVLVKQAEALFNKKQYEESAAKYAKTNSSFEEIALKFLQASQNRALKTFLHTKLKELRSGDKAQVTMLVLWILELLLSQLGSLRNKGNQKTIEYESLQTELDAFLIQPQVVDCVRTNRSAVYDLMASHGDKENIINLAKANKDFEKVISYHLNQQDFLQALNALREQSMEELWYLHAPVLIQAIPKQTIAEIMKLNRPLNPSKLLPALVAADTDQSGELIRYLEYCIRDLNCQQQAVHNFLLSMYAQHRPDRLMRYIAMQGEDPSMVNYDIAYGVRVCREFEHLEACVQLSALLGLWEAAIDLALTVNVQLAKQTAQQSPHNLQRKLWLKIAQHVVEEKNDIAQAMEFLQQCEQIKIEDILPFFSDFVTIDHFKDAICSSLQEYNQHIQDLKEEMEDATKCAEQIRDEIQAFRSRCAIIQASDTCCTCDIQLLLRPFYAFPCGHRFHTDCLESQLSPLLSIKTREKLQMLQRQLMTGSETMSLVGKVSLKSQIDSILASQCLFCGDHMIDLIGKPFIEDEDYERIKKEWE